MCATHATEHENNWDQLGLGTHMCSLYRNKDEQFSPVIPFFSEGFKKHQRCVYIFEESSPEEISSMIHNAETDPATEAAPADLEVLSYKETYTKGGSFDPDTVVALFEDKVAASLSQGYSGMRAAAEMSWVLANGTPIEKLIEYEQKLNVFYPTRKVTGVCQYNEEKFSPEFLINVIRTHPYVIVRGELYKNDYFYTDPKYAGLSVSRFKAHDYETILSIITDSEPIA